MGLNLGLLRPLVSWEYNRFSSDQKKTPHKKKTKPTPAQMYNTVPAQFEINRKIDRRGGGEEAVWDGICRLQHRQMLELVLRLCLSVMISTSWTAILIQAQPHMF